MLLKVFLQQCIKYRCCLVKQPLSIKHHHGGSVFSHHRFASSVPQVNDTIQLCGQTYLRDDCTNVTPRVLTKVNKNLHNTKLHPINIIQRRIVNYFYANFVNRSGNPIFAVFDNIPPVVTVQQNFDSLLIPENHPSRSPSDTYYVNSKHLLRCHTSAHQKDLIRMGFNTFLVVGDVYRRDEIDSSHYPVFHQIEGVRLFTENELFSGVKDSRGMHILEDGKRNLEKQAHHTIDTVKLLEHDLKQTLLGLAHTLFGKDIEYRWVGCYFPFTHPSWELEIMFNGDWMEVLGCGIVEQKILSSAGAQNRVGWAFGLGLERLAMKLFAIPDIRLFWSEDPGFLTQFHVKNINSSITYKPISQFPPCINDLSFWVPSSFKPNDFYDLVRSVGGDVVERVSLIDEFKHPKTGKTSHCYRLVYRHMEKTFAQDEVNLLHQQIAENAIQFLSVEVR